MTQPEASPSTLDELFVRDPTTLSDQDVEKMILTFREARSRWVAEEQKAKVSGKRASPSAGIKAGNKEANKKLELGDLEL